MNLKFSILLGFLFVVSLGIAQDTPKNVSLQWNNGFQLESPDKQFSLKFGGRIMIDHAFFNQDTQLDRTFGVLETKNGIEFRRARLFASGKLYSNIVYKLQVDFAGGEVAFKDAYIGITKLPIVGTMLVGHVKKPFRFEALTSSKYITFMERAFPIDFSQERNTGILFFNTILKKKVSVAAGYFRNTDASGNNLAANDGHSITARIAGLAYTDKEKKQALHLGLGFSSRKPDSKTYKITSRPEAHLSSVKYISTGTLNAVKNVQLFNFETIFMLKSVTFQGEYLVAKVDRQLPRKYHFNSQYGQVSYFLTGESKNYKASKAVFGRIDPLHNFGSQDGFGALEVALRYSSSNLNSHDIAGGEQTNLTIGLNWYLNPNTKIMLNHIRSTIKNQGKLQVFQARFQIDF